MLREEFAFFEKAPELADPLMPFVYLDSAATMQRPDMVIRAESDYYQTLNANPLRGLYKISEQSTKLLNTARKKVAHYIGADPDELVFVKSTTEGINLVANGVVEMIEGQSVILIDIDAHHSNILPFTERYKKQARVSNDLMGDYQKSANKVKIISLTGLSNVSGRDQTGLVKEMRAKGYEGLILLDAAQLIAHKKIDVKKMGVDFLVFSGHKIGAPMGVGVLYMKRELMGLIKPLNYGGEMVESVRMVDGKIEADWAFGPQKYEGGTINMGGVAGLLKAIEFWEHYNKSNQLFEETEELTRYTVQKMQTVGKIKIYFGENGIVLFNIEGVHAHDTAQILSNYGVMVRAGWHCAEPFLTMQEIGPAVRASLAFYNTRAEVDYFVSILKRIRGEMGFEK